MSLESSSLSGKGAVVVAAAFVVVAAIVVDAAVVGDAGWSLSGHLDSK